MLNFDIFIIIIIIFAVINGLIRGLSRQILASLGILIPTGVIYFTYPLIFKFVDSVAIVSKITSPLYKVIKMFLNISSDNFSKLFVVIIIYLLIYFVMKVILDSFSVSTKKLLKANIKPVSRYIGGGLGLINAYIMILITFVLVNPLVIMNPSQPLTKNLFLIFKPFTDLLGHIL